VAIIRNLPIYKGFLKKVKLYTFNLVNINQWLTILVLIYKGFLAARG